MGFEMGRKEYFGLKERRKDVLWLVFFEAFELSLCVSLV